MNAFKFALGAMLAAGVTAALPLPSHAQYPPGGVNSALAEQRRQKQEADAEVARLQKEVKKVKDRIQAKYETKEEWETAKTELKAAETAYDGARKKAVAKLYSRPDYKAAKDKQLKSEQALQALQSSAKPNEKDLAKAQQDRLEAGIALRKLETAALAEEPKVGETKEKVAEAKKAWEALQDELKEALAGDPEYLAAQDQLAQAQQMAEQMKMSLAQQAAADREARRAAAEGARGGGRSPRPPTGGRGAYGGVR
jgi:hypothetical protein